MTTDASSHKDLVAVHVVKKALIMIVYVSCDGYIYWMNSS